MYTVNFHPDEISGSIIKYICETMIDQVNSLVGKLVFAKLPRSIFQLCVANPQGHENLSQSQQP